MLLFSLSRPHHSRPLFTHLFLYPLSRRRVVEEADEAERALQVRAQERAEQAAARAAAAAAATANAANVLSSGSSDSAAAASVPTSAAAAAAAALKQSADEQAADAAEDARVQRLGEAAARSRAVLNGLGGVGSRASGARVRKQLDSAKDGGKALREERARQVSREVEARDR